MNPVNPSIPRFRGSPANTPDGRPVTSPPLTNRGRQPGAGDAEIALPGRPRGGYGESRALPFPHNPSDNWVRLPGKPNDNWLPGPGIPIDTILPRPGTPIDPMPRPVFPSLPPSVRDLVGQLTRIIDRLAANPWMPGAREMMNRLLDTVNRLLDGPRNRFPGIPEFAKPIFRPAVEPHRVTTDRPVASKPAAL